MLERVLNTFLKLSCAAGYLDSWQAKENFVFFLRNSLCYSFDCIFFEQRQKGNPLEVSLSLSKKANGHEMGNPKRRYFRLLGNIKN